jgi:hypothetical protein
MKQQDIAMIIVIAFFSGIFAWFVSNAFIGAPGNRQTNVEVVEPIVAEFTQPDPRFFNEDSVNPTQIIEIKDSSNNRPFN